MPQDARKSRLIIPTSRAGTWHSSTARIVVTLVWLGKAKLKCENLLEQFDEQIRDAVTRRHIDEDFRVKYGSLPTSHQLSNYACKPNISTALRVISTSNINRWGGSLNENCWLDQTI